MDWFWYFYNLISYSSMYSFFVSYPVKMATWLAEKYRGFYVQYIYKLIAIYLLAFVGKIIV